MSCLRDTLFCPVRFRTTPFVEILATARVVLKQLLKPITARTIAYPSFGGREKLDFHENNSHHHFQYEKAGADRQAGNAPHRFAPWSGPSLRLPIPPMLDCDPASSGHSWSPSSAGPDLHHTGAQCQRAGAVRYPIADRKDCAAIRPHAGAGGGRPRSPLHDDDERVPDQGASRSAADPRLGLQGSLPGPTFQVQSGSAILVNWINALPTQSFAGGSDDSRRGRPIPRVRNVVHLHGAKVQPDSDGYPEAWFTPGKSALYFYPNQQQATTLWYHDHALGIVRLNNYAGLAGDLHHS